MSFARPHIETHSRGKGHSSVAGVAYRMGLDLVDARTATRYNYTKKSDVVEAFHLTPSDSAEWMKTPEQFWNRAEGAEKRKDSQVARDYRCPIPLDFSKAQAKKLVKVLGEFLLSETEAPVSVALHRDSAIDRFGEKKKKVGFHVHFYIPARGVTSDGFAEKKEGIFAQLNNPKTSGEVVERWNEAWAKACNDIASDNDLPEIYTHKSYARQGIERTPEPTMGPNVVALERRKVRTRRGAEVRAVRKVEAKEQELSILRMEALSEKIRQASEALNQEEARERSEQINLRTIDKTFQHRKVKLGEERELITTRERFWRTLGKKSETVLRVEKREREVEELERKVTTLSSLVEDFKQRIGQLKASIASLRNQGWSLAKAHERRWGSTPVKFVFASLPSVRETDSIGLPLDSEAYHKIETVKFSEQPQKAQPRAPKPA